MFVIQQVKNLDAELQNRKREEGGSKVASMESHARRAEVTNCRFKVKFF